MKCTHVYISRWLWQLKGLTTNKQVFISDLTSTMCLHFLLITSDSCLWHLSWLLHATRISITCVRALWSIKKNIAAVKYLPQNVALGLRILFIVVRVVFNRLPLAAPFAANQRKTHSCSLYASNSLVILRWQVVAYEACVVSATHFRTRMRAPLPQRPTLPHRAVPSTRCSAKATSTCFLFVRLHFFPFAVVFLSFLCTFSDFLIWLSDILFCCFSLISCLCRQR